MDHGTVDDPKIGQGSWGPKASPPNYAGPFCPAPKVRSIRYGPEPRSRGRGQGRIPAHEPSIPVTTPPLTLVKAALANRDIQSYLNDPRLAGIWTVEGVTRHPKVRAVFEHAEVIGGPGESLAAARHKNFGRFLGIQPLRPDSPVYLWHSLFFYKATST